MSYLRSIALTIDEPAPGQFSWLLIENVGASHVEQVALLAADAAHDTWGAALREGVDALEGLAANDDRGPRGDQFTLPWGE